jgi:eukaryotic-like serine/threonine-protein kinase
MKLTTGTHLGRYEILAEIGRGGMGVVYRARDPKIDRLVAVKTISLFGHEPEDVREYRERFVFEARAAGRLSHPGIVTIFDVGEEPENHDPYIVMEYVTGESLRKLLAAENRKIPLRATLQLVQELAEALHYAHSQGVIHRDIKPSNVLVTPETHAKIADFGIAKLNLAQLTIPGQILGSPAYMSPEQLSGEGVDARSDLFSLGVILYTMITGYRPFQGNSATTVCFKVVNRDPIPVTSFDADLPAELDEIITRAMAKNPADRFQSGAEMAEVIASFRDSHTLSEKGKLSTTGTGLPARTRTSTSSKTAASGLRRTDGSAQDRLGNGKRATSEKLFWSGGAALLLVASFVLYQGIASHWTRPAIAPQAPAQQLANSERQTAASAPPSLPAATDLTQPRQKPARTKRTSEDEDEAPRVSAGTAEPANMQIEIQHPFAEAEVTIWLDNRAVYTRLLHGETTKHRLIFRQVRGYRTDSIQVPAGPHEVHVRVHSADNSYDQSKNIIGLFAAKGESFLHILCDKHSDGLSLTLE